jgi:DNA-binding NarL/FixJ family response regulator
MREELAMSIESNVPPNQITVAILSAQSVVRVGLAQLFKSTNVVITSEASTVEEAVTLMPQSRPDVAIVDPDSDEITLHAITQLGEANITRVLVFTGVPDPKVHQHAFELGAMGVVSKEQPPETLVRAVKALKAGEAWMERLQAANLLNAIRRRRDPDETKIESLTKREREIIALVGHGLSSALIGAQLFISEATVRNHLTSILGKLELANRYELAVYAFRHGLAQLPEREALKVEIPTGGRDARRALGR